MTSSTGCSGIHALRVAAKSNDAITHGREVNDARHAGEVLEQHASRHEGHFLRRRAARPPSSQRSNVVGVDKGMVFAPEQVLEQDFQRERKPVQVTVAGSLERRQTVDLERV